MLTRGHGTFIFRLSTWTLTYRYEFGFEPVSTEAKTKVLRVGELARAVGKSVRAVHLYEELGLLRPVSRTAGGFRLFTADAVDRINWITKLQAIGFSLSEIQGFVREFESAESGRSATARVRDVFQDKLSQIRNSLMQLRVIENDLVEALEYLEGCQECAPRYTTGECRRCDHQGHELGVAPGLFAGLSGGNPVAAVPPTGEQVSTCGGLVGLRGGRHERAPAADGLPEVEELDEIEARGTDQETREDRN